MSQTLEKRAQHELPIESAVFQKESERHPDRNEDAVIADKEAGLFAVFDGLGGHAAGEVASRLAMEYVKKELVGMADDLSIDEYKQALEVILKEASQHLLDEEEKHDEYAGMGTTASVLKIFDDRGLYGHIGDSRIYSWSKGSGLIQQTPDDDCLSQKNVYISEMNKSFRFSDEDRKELRYILANVASPEDWVAYGWRPELLQGLFRLRNIINQALGGKGRINPHIGEFGVSSGEYIIICSDGISDNLTAKEIEAIMQEASDPQSAGQKLLDAALARSQDEDHIRHKSDDMSVVVIRIP